MTEEEVYQGSKNYLVRMGYSVFEIKDVNPERGSKFAYKPDLVAYKDGCFVIIECKPTFNYNDYLKLKSVINSPTRLWKFFCELRQYHLMERVGYMGSFEDFSASIQISLAYAGEMNCDYADINHIVVRTWMGDASSTLE